MKFPDPEHCLRYQVDCIEQIHQSLGNTILGGTAQVGERLRAPVWNRIVEKDDQLALQYRVHNGQPYQDRFALPQVSTERQNGVLEVA